ncbi:TPA: hypothetical protein HA278_00960 [Candidatus Woesearchaeota archaeon]|nr:hypothetical protein [Candidatus Woesearchaeota archaeon]
MAGLQLSSSITEIWGRKILRKNRYGVSFYGKGVEAAGGTRPILELLMRNCEVASMVGTSFSSAPNRIHGPVREMPYEKLYSGDLSLTFRENHSAKIRRFFTKWQDLMYVTDSGNFNYYDDYIGNIEIHQYTDGEDESSRYGIRLNEVYPKNIHEATLGYAVNDSYQTQIVDFSFRSWEEVN